MAIVRRAAIVCAGALLSAVPLAAAGQGPYVPAAGIVQGQFHIEDENTCIYDLHFVGRIQAGSKTYTLLRSTGRMTHGCIHFTVGPPHDVPLTLDLRGTTPQGAFTWSCSGSVDLYRNVGYMETEPLTCETAGYPGSFPMNLTIDRSSHVRIGGGPDGRVAGAYVLREDPLRDP